jgi:hypothetical protein
MSDESENNKRNPPWTMTTIGEVIDATRLLIENEDCELDTPIVWYHLQNDCLTGVSHECCHVFHEDESWVELTLHNPHEEA